MTPEDIGRRRVGEGWFAEDRLGCRRLVEDDRRGVLVPLEIDRRFDRSRIEIPT